MAITFTFDGSNKRITINANPSDYVNNTLTFSAIDVYSAWKEWCVNDVGLQYPPAFRAIGNDPIGDGVYVGSYFFMQDGWMGIPPQVDNTVLVLTGNLYPETAGVMVIDPLPEYTTTLIMQNSALALRTHTESSTSGLTAEEIAQAVLNTDIGCI